MEMEMEQQSVRIDMGNSTQVAAANGERTSINALDLSSSISTSNSSSCTSSLQSSPDLNTTASNSPNLSPSQAADPQIFTIHVNGAVPAAGSNEQPHQRSSKAEAMQSLKESIPHSMKLQKLHKLEKTFQKDASYHKKAGRRLSKELYMIVSMYALMQGALFAAVAQSSVFKCADNWGPVCIAVAVTVGMLRSALEKLWRMGKEKQEVEKFQRRQSAVYDKIELLHFKGSACTMSDLEPQHDDVFESGRGFVFSPHGLLVLGFLVGFSALIIVSCTYMLCRPCHCHPA